MVRFDTRVSPIGPRRIIKGLVILIVILMIGSMGYMTIEKWNFSDSLYMTVITITTVGFREVGNISKEGRIFTIFIIFSGMGIIAYILGMAAQAMVDFQVGVILGRRKLGRTLRSIKNHYVICGFGRIGKIICRELKENNIPMVIIVAIRKKAGDMKFNPSSITRIEAGDTLISLGKSEDLLKLAKILSVGTGGARSK